MKLLWAPWRIEYIRGSVKTQGCILCRRPSVKMDAENLVLWRNRHVFVMMNRFPYNPGHLMIAPVRHVAAVEQLTRPESRDLFTLLLRAVIILKQEYEPQGFNIGMNLGRTAGAGVEDHLHLHVVPRWDGDTNFMPVTGQTKVVSEHLLESYQRLKPGFDRLKLEA